MFKRIILVSAGVFLFFGSNIAYAEIIINEVQLNPVAERFIELYNSDNLAVDLTGWYIQRKTATGNDFSSLVSKTYFENKTINANDYFLISKDTLGLSAFTLTESNTIQLKNSDQKVADKIGWGNGESSVADNPPDGKSIQRTDTGWIIASPTPSASNLSSSVNNSINMENNANNNNSLTQNKIELPTIKTKIIAKSLAFAGIPLEFQANNLGYSGEMLNYGRNFWNFGDGDSKEQINNFDKFSHIYSYPGKYIVSLEYYANYYSEIPDTINKITIDVIPLSIIISKVGDEKDFFIELKNNSDYEMDISKWVLSSLNKTFVLPKNTGILSKSKIILSPKITNFTIGDEKNLKLATPTGEIIFNYGVPAIDKQIELSNNIKNPIVSAGKLETVNLEKINTENLNFYNNLSAGAIKSEIVDKNNSYLFFMGFAILLAVSSGAVYFIRQKKIALEEGSDFEILDE
ncbi:MAG: lamin tail domain-containing protein [Patescibacteria group bacterium]